MGERISRPQNRWKECFTNALKLRFTKPAAIIPGKSTYKYSQNAASIVKLKLIYLPEIKAYS